MHKLYRWDRQLAILLMVAFFLPLRMQVFVLMPICIFFAVRDIILWKENRRVRLTYAVVLGSLYLLYAAYLPFTSPPYRGDVRFHLESKVSLLLFPLMMACLHSNTVSKIIRQLHWFVIGCLLSCAAGNLLYFCTSPSSHLHLINHVSYRLGFERITGVHPTYMGMYLCFSTAVLLWHDRLTHWLKSWQLLILLLMTFSFLFALFPKTPLIALLLILAYYCAVSFRTPAKWKVPLAAFGIAVAVAFAIPFTSQRAIELKGLFSAGKVENPVENSVNMRRIIWSIDKQLLKQSWRTGVGPGQIRTKLQQMYFGLSTMSGTPMEYYDTHNEYLNIWISFGLIGIVLLLLILFIQFMRATRHHQHLYICLLAILCICFTTENILANQRGIVFYGFFTSLMFFSLAPKKIPE